MIITRVTLNTLKNPSILNKFRAQNCTFCGFENNMFIVTFQLDNADAEELLQDLAIDFTDRHHPEVFISEPYQFGNAESEA